MLIVTLINNLNRDYILEEVNSIIELFKKKKIELKLNVINESDKDFINISIEEEEYTLGVEKLLNLYIANILYNVVINRFCERNVCKYLSATYSFLNFNDLKVVKNIIEKTLREEKPIDETMIYCMNKKNHMIRKIILCLEENKEINVKGFVDFRVKLLDNDINNILERVVESYMVEKEYNEFINLLKYFVDIQECKVEEVNIFIEENGDYIVKDNYGNDVLNNLTTELCNNKNIDEINKDDLIISGLITTSPKKIIIHNVENCRNKELINTIKNVFEDRVKYCNHCNHCEPLKIF